MVYRERNRLRCSVCGNRSETGTHEKVPSDPLTLWNKRTGDNEAVCFSCALSNPRDLYSCCKRVVRRIMRGGGVLKKVKGAKR